MGDNSSISSHSGEKKYQFAHILVIRFPGLKLPVTKLPKFVDHPQHFDMIESSIALHGKCFTHLLALRSNVVLTTSLDGYFGSSCYSNV